MMSWFSLTGPKYLKSARLKIPVLQIWEKLLEVIESIYNARGRVDKELKCDYLAEFRLNMQYR